MKIKRNQLAVFTDDITDEELYFTQYDCKELKLRRNQKNISWWDGCNWKSTKISFKEIIAAIDYECITINPAFFYKREYKFEDGSTLTLTTSNESRSLTPWWEVTPVW